MSNQYANITQAFSNYNPLKLSRKSMQPGRVGRRREKKAVAQATGQWAFVIYRSRWTVIIHRSSPSSSMQREAYPPSSSCPLATALTKSRELAHPPHQDLPVAAAGCPALCTFSDVVSNVLGEPSGPPEVYSHRPAHKKLKEAQQILRSWV